MTSASVDELVGKMQAFATGLEQGKNIHDVAKAVKGEFLKGPPRVGIGRSSSLRWGAGYDVRRDGRSAIVKYRGNLHWIERGTSPHLIVPKAAKGSRKTRLRNAAGGLVPITKSGARALSFNGVARRKVHHPGTRPRRFFQRVISDSADAALKAGRNSIVDQLKAAGFGR